MPISALEIAAIFKLEDQASVTLGKISESLKKISDQLKAVVDQAQAAFDKIGTTFTKMDTGVQSQIKQTNELAAAWDRVAASARAADSAVGAGAAEGLASKIGLPNLPGPRRQNLAQQIFGAGGGGHGGVAGLNQHIKVPTPFGNSYLGPGMLGGGLAGNAMLAAGAAGGWGLYEDSQIMHEAFNAMYIGADGKVPTDEEMTSRMAMFRRLVMEQSVKNLMPYNEVARAATQEIRLGGGVDDQGKPYSIEARLRNLPSLLSAAAAETRMKPHTTLEQNTEAFIKFAHQMKEYNPDELAKLYPGLSYLSTKVSETPEQILRASGYHLPVATSMGIDPMQDMVLQIMMERAGISNTKSGTWLANMALRAMPYAPGTHSDKEEKIHQELLGNFGLIDSDGNPTWNTNGHPDEMKMLKIIHDRMPELKNKYGPTLPDVMHKLFGSQGERAVTLLSDPKLFSQMEGIDAGQKAFNPANYMNQALKFDPSAKFQQEWLKLEGVLIDLGDKALPVVVKMLESFDKDVNAISAAITKLDSIMPGWAKTAIGTAAGHLLNPMSTIDDARKVGGVVADHLPQSVTDAAKKAGGFITNHLPSWPFGSQAPDHYSIDDISKALQSNTTTLPQKQSYNVIPSKENPKPITLAAQLNIDGTQLAQTIASKLADIYENSPNGPSSNDASYYDANGGIAAG